LENVDFAKVLSAFDESECFDNINVLCVCVEVPEENMFSMSGEHVACHAVNEFRTKKEGLEDEAQSPVAESVRELHSSSP
jgi:hypothetical protein